MSQREKRGLSWYPAGLAVAAGDCATSCPACAVSVSATPLLCRIPADSASSALGVAHPTSPPINISPLRFPPRLVCPPSIVFGVGQPASVTASVALGVAQPATCFNDGPPVLPMHSCGPVPSFALAVGHAASAATLGSISRRDRTDPSWFTPVSLIPGVSFLSLADAVGHAASIATWESVVTAVHPICTPRATAARFRERCCSGVPPGSDDVGVGHPVQPLSPVRRADGMCAQYRSPKGVAR
jgi:hypothetical protein